MGQLFGKDLAYVQSLGFGGFAEAAAPEIIRLLRSAPAHVRRVVDEGCGAGPLTAALAAAGFEVTGVDGSAELLAIARAAVPGANFIHGSLYETPIPKCEAIIAFGEPLTYHSDLEMADMRVAIFFRRASEILPEGGMLIFDVIELGEPSAA